MTTQHTPGPWQSRDDMTTDGFVTIIANVDGEIHCDGTTSYTYDVVCRCEDDFGERLPNVAANVRLIAAAPELLAELDCRVGDLVMLRKAIEAGDPRAELFVRIDDMLRETRAAIAKAKGEQPA